MKITGKIAENGYHSFDADQQSKQGQKVEQTWIIVADSARGHIYRQTSHGLEMIGNAEPSDSNANTETFDGHTFQVSEGQDHQGNAQENDKHNDTGFTDSLLEWLNMANNEHTFDKLILVADPRTLGHMRSNLNPNVKNKVVAELDKNLTKVPLKELQEHLAQVLAA